MSFDSTKIRLNNLIDNEERNRSNNFNSLGKEVIIRKVGRSRISSN